MPEKTHAKRTTLHGSAVAFDKDGGLSAVLLRGASGAGKSDLAFRLIESGARLVSDDQVECVRRNDRIFLGSADSIRNMLEVRGIGLVKYPAEASVVLRLVIDLAARESVPRLPEWETVSILDIPVPRLHLCAFDSSTPLKIRKAMDIVGHPELLVK